MTQDINQEAQSIIDNNEAESMVINSEAEEIINSINVPPVSGAIFLGYYAADSAKPLWQAPKGSQKPYIVATPEGRIRFWSNTKGQNFQEEAVKVSDLFLDFIPGIGEIKGILEANEAFQQKQYIIAGIIAAATAIGVVPVVGDVIAKPFKVAAKTSVNIFKKIVKGLQDAGVSQEGIKKLISDGSLGNATGDVVGKKASIPNANEKEIIDEHIRELTVRARQEGFEVSEDAIPGKSSEEGGSATGFDRSLPNTGPGSVGFIRFSPIKTKADYLTALEEFEHALNSPIVKTSPDLPSVDRLREEIRAKKAAANNSRIEFSIADYEIALGDTFKSYLSLLRNAINEGTLEQAIDLLPDVNDPMWKWANISPPINKEKLIKELKVPGSGNAELSRLDGIINNYQADTSGFLGARASTPKTFYLRESDGSITTFSGTKEELLEQWGITADQFKKGKGRLNDGRQFNVDQNAFGDARTATGDAIVKDDFLDPNTVTLEDTVGQRKYLPGTNTLDLTARKQLEKDVDLVLSVHMHDLLDPQGYDGYWSTGDFVEGGFEATARQIAENAWPDIIVVLEKYKELGADAYNKIVQWARARSVKIFDNPEKGITGVDERLEGLGKSNTRILRELQNANPGKFDWVNIEDFKNLGQKGKQILTLKPNPLNPGGLLYLTDLGKGLAFKTAEGRKALDTQLEGWSKINSSTHSYNPTMKNIVDSWLDEVKKGWSNSITDSQWKAIHKAFGGGGESTFADSSVPELRARLFSGTVFAGGRQVGFFSSIPKIIDRMGGTNDKVQFNNLKESLESLAGGEDLSNILTNDEMFKYKSILSKQRKLIAGS